MRKNEDGHGRARLAEEVLRFDRRVTTYLLPPSCDLEAVLLGCSTLVMRTTTLTQRPRTSVWITLKPAAVGDSKHLRGTRQAHPVLDEVQRSLQPHSLESGAFTFLQRLSCQ